MLPVGPIGFGNSPYNSFSAFAGNPLLISLDDLAEMGYLVKREIRPLPASVGRVHYERVKAYKEERLVRAFARFKPSSGFEHFCRRERYWLDDYALFCALKRGYRDKAFTEWPRSYVKYEPLMLRNLRGQLAAKIKYHQFVQYIFDRQWHRLRAYAKKAGIGLIGDVPIYVAPDSADVWAHKEIFYVGNDGKPLWVAGTPPDYFTRHGQLWGNPLYRWDVLKRRRYDWWVMRLKRSMQLFDAIRLDHFIGYERYWRVKASAKTALGGRWVKGPGAHFFKTVLPLLRSRQIIAEDLGVVTKEVENLRDQFKFMGIQVLHFTLGQAPRRHVVVYTGTHDNDTTRGWFKRSANKKEILKALQCSPRQVPQELIATAMKSDARLAVTPVQDILGLDSWARMNMPGSAKGNWEWRMVEDDAHRSEFNMLRKLTERYGRAA